MRITLPYQAVRTLIIGPPGSGKGTISARMCRDFDMFHLSSGDLLRSGIQNKNSPVGVAAKKYVEAGELVPDEIMVPLILSELKKIPSSKSWVLDGFPRSSCQAQSLHDSETIHSAINLDVPFKTIVERLSGRWIHLPSGRVYNDGFNPPQRSGFDDLTHEPLTQREDDKPETIKRRLNVYLEQTKPILEFYQRSGVLNTFSGMKTDEIYPMVVQHLKKLQSKHSADHKMQ